MAYRIPASILLLLLMAAAHLIFILSHWHSIPLDAGNPVGPTDPDPWLRLHLVREWLTSGDWFTHIVPRANAPFAEPVSPWTRPLDLVIAALVQLQPGDVALDMRLMRAALLLPWLWTWLLMAGILRILHRSHPAPVTYLMALFFAAMMPIIWNYFGLGNADHHAPLAVLFMWAIGGVLVPSQTRATAACTGILLGVMLWISMEAAILIALIYSWYGLRWLRGEAHAADLLATLASSVALTSLVALMVEHPRAQWFTPVYDANSIVYVTLMTLAALLAWQLKLTRASHPLQKLAVAVGAGILFSGFFFLLFPLALHGPLAQVTPFVTDEFLPRITEAKPLYKSDLLMIVASCYHPLLVLLILGAAWKAPPYSFFSRSEAAGLAYFSATLFLLYFSQQRWGYYAFPFLCLSIAPVMAALFEPHHPAFAQRWPARALQRLSPGRQDRYRLPLVLLMAGIPLLLMVLNGPLTRYTTPAAERAAKERREACYREARIALRSGALNQIEGGRSLTLLAPTDLGTEILFFTRHRIVASNYHREGDAMQYVWDAEKISDTVALKHHLAQRRVDAILVCPTLHTTPGAILPGLSEGKAAPTWLKELTISSTPQADNTLLRLFRVKVNTR